MVLFKSASQLPFQQVSAIGKEIKRTWRGCYNKGETNGAFYKRAKTHIRMQHAWSAAAAEKLQLLVGGHGHGLQLCVNSCRSYILSPNPRQTRGHLSLLRNDHHNICPEWKSLLVSLTFELTLHKTSVITTSTKKAQR